MLTSNMLWRNTWIWKQTGCVIGMMIFMSFFKTNLIFGQAEEATLPSATADSACDEIQEDHNRYRCFVYRFNERLERAFQAQSQPIKPPPKSLELIRAEELRQKREQEKAEMRRLIEASRRRNTSKAGQKYRITFGQIQELRD